MVVFLANILVLMAVSYMVWKKDRHAIRPFFWPGLMLKVASGIALGVLYRYYYTIGDTFVYYSDSLHLVKLAQHDFSEYVRFLFFSETPEHVLPDIALVAPRALFFTKFVSVVMLVCGSNYWLATCYFSLFSFLSAWFLVAEIEDYDTSYSRPAVFAFLFFPSVVFWTSGLIKESLAMACLYFIVKFFLRLWGRKTIPVMYWLLIPFSVWILWGLKYYYAVVLLPILFTELVMQRIIRPNLKTKNIWITGGIWILVFLFPACIATVVHPNFYPERFFEVIVSNHDIFIAISEPSDVIRYHNLQSNGLSILQNSPQAFFSGVFRPFIWEATTSLQIVAALENSLLAILSLAFLSRLIKNVAISPLAFTVLLYCIFLATFLALSTPNFGTLSRYRIGFLPFFVLLISSRNLLVRSLEGFLQRKFSRLVH